MKINLPFTQHTWKNVTALPCKMQNLFIRLKAMLHSSKRWWLWKEPVVMCVNWNVMQATSQQVFKVTTFCTDTWFQSFSPLINCIVHYALLKFSPCCNEMLPQLVRIADSYSIHALLQHAPDTVIYRVEVRAVGWPHVRTDELRCLTAQKLDCVTSTMCWRIVLLEDKRVSSNAADRW